jgi:N,N'-diacetyllegionaminate synthase
MTNSTFIVAEVGSVHDGSFGNAIKLIEAAAAIGVDAVKFQTHIPKAETLPDAPMPPYFKGEPRFDYFQRTGFTRLQWQEIKQACDTNSVEFMSSPFSIEAVMLLEEISMTRYKIPSGEITNIPLLEAVGQTGKPVILSSGMSPWSQLDDAVNTIRNYGNDMTVLQCTSSYPCAYEDVGLNVMVEMRARYGTPVGLSDHTLTTYASLAAVTLGASVIEKHLTFSRLMYGSDARHSLIPEEFADLVQGIRAVETMLASMVDKNAMANQMVHMKQIFEKSVVTLVPIRAGTVITSEMVGVKKPGTGIPARRLNEVIGQRATRDLDTDTLLAEEDLS